MTEFATRIVIATVSENRLPYTRDVEFLFRTLRRFGGSLSGAPCFAYFVDSVGQEVRKRLEDLSVEIRVVGSVNVRFPWANKIRMMEDGDDFDYLVGLDNDIVVCKDFSAYINGRHFAAKPVDHDPFGIENWEKLFNYFSLGLPALRFRTTFSGIETIPYFNSGVLIIPRLYVSTLRDAWLTYLPEVIKSYARYSQFSKRSWFADQIALSLALASTGIPYRPLPLEMNFPIHHEIHATHNPTMISPLLIHHHHRIALTGEIAASCYANVNRSILEINQHLFPGLHRGRYAQLRRTQAKVVGLLNRILNRMVSVTRSFWQHVRSTGGRQIEI